MTPALDELLGIDPDDTMTVAAEQDAEAYASLIEMLVVLRRRRGLTQQDVATYMETTQSVVSDFERIGGNARYSTLQRYARAVGARLCSMVDPTGAELAPTWRKAAEMPIRLSHRDAERLPFQAPWTEASEGVVKAL
ncbi:helix-turn-helix domain-containing protein [Streptomyces sp. NPDC127051]|uniref:helix-turn-helix domain-containing protein n=1 Tax=Streptomyces sp. NPDC127051 TaxID=3347119 RepID=UPI003658FC76